MCKITNYDVKFNKIIYLHSCKGTNNIVTYAQKVYIGDNCFITKMSCDNSGFWKITINRCASKLDCIAVFRSNSKDVYNRLEWFASELDKDYELAGADNYFAYSNGYYQNSYVRMFRKLFSSMYKTMLNRKVTSWGV